MFTATKNATPSRTVCIFGFKGASTSKVIGVRNEMMMDDYDGQMIFGDLVGLKFPDIRRTGEEKPRKNLTQETCPDRGSNPGPLRDTHACYNSFKVCVHWHYGIQLLVSTVGCRFTNSLVLSLPTSTCLCYMLRLNYD